MRILSKFHDYYDSAMAFGTDATVVYVRNTETKPLKKFEMSELFFNYWHDFPFRRQALELHFCGKRYIGVRLYDSLTCPTLDQTFWNAESLIAFVEEYDPPKGLNYQKFVLPKYWDRKFESWRKINNHFAFSRDGIKQYFDSKPIRETPVNMDLRCPIVLYAEMITGDTRDADEIRNPCLKDYNFYTVIDAYQAYQTLDMYVSGVLPTSGRPMAVVSDNVRLAKHGFDNWSFRKKVR